MALLAAALLSVVFALPLLPSAKLKPDRFVLEARVSSATVSSLQVFFDDGAGFREEYSSSVALRAGTTPETYLLPIASGTYTGLRLDPPADSRKIVLHSLRVVTRDGRTIDQVDLAAFKAVHQIQSLLFKGGQLEITTTAKSDDPQIVNPLPQGLRARYNWRDYARDLPPYASGIFGALVLLLFILDRVPRWRAGVAGKMASLADRPGRAVALIAAVAVIGSAYPVIFLGKSFVSPNLGTTLLYDEYPTLPGYKSRITTDPKLSDVGAVMWQHVPFSTIQHRALWHAELPLWNRYNALGVPLLAQGQSMFGDPLHFLVVATNGAAAAWDLKYLIAKWLFATGLGLTVLALLRPNEKQSPVTPPGTADSTTSLFPESHAALFSACATRPGHSTAWCASPKPRRVALRPSGLSAWYWPTLP